MSILVVGGGVVQSDSDGIWVTKAPIASYLNELGECFDGCTWLAPADKGKTALTGRLDSRRVTLVPYVDLRRNAPRNWLRLVQLCRARPYCLLYLPAILWLFPVLPIVHLLCRRVGVYLAGDYEAQIQELASRKWPGWATLFRFVFERSLGSADLVFARGRHLARLARRMNDNVIETVPIGHNGTYSRSTDRMDRPHRARRILYLGKLTDGKGVRDLLCAFGRVVELRRQGSVFLDVVGDGADRPSIEEDARRLGLGASVRFHGWVDATAKVLRFLGRADLVVVPSSTSEGVPRVLDEAVMAGVPVVATRVGGVAHEFDEGEVMLVGPQRPQELARAIETVLFDDDVRRTLVARAGARREHWLSAGSAARQHARALLEKDGHNSAEVTGNRADRRATRR